MLSAVKTYSTPVTEIAAGGYHSLVLKNDGSLFAMGTNSYGQLGNGNYNNTGRPEQIVTNNVAVIAGGYLHSLFLMSDGSLWAMGYNSDGELGDGTYNNTNRPEQIVSNNVVAIAGGYYHTLFIKGDGSLWAMGDNEYGQLGDTNKSDLHTNRPQQIVASNVVAIAAGDFHSLFLKSDGSLWAMGYDYYGQLGNGNSGDNANRSLPVQIVTNNVVAIAGGGEHSLFLKSDGSLWAMGNNGYGQLGDGTTDKGNYYTNHPEQILASNVVAIAAGEYHNLILKSDGSLWAMGDNNNGQLGDGSYNDASQLEQIVARGVTAIAAGAAHSLFLKSDGSLWAMGLNDAGQLGNGNFNQTDLPGQILAGSTSIASISLAGTNLILNGIYGVPGYTNYLLMTTNCAEPRNQWIRMATNILNTSGNFTLTITNAVNPNASQQFYNLQLQ